jgi:hypothetical protein
VLGDRQEGRRSSVTAVHAGSLSSALGHVGKNTLHPVHLLVLHPAPAHPSDSVSSRSRSARRFPQSLPARAHHRPTLRYGAVAWAAKTYGRVVVRHWTSNLAGWSGPIEWTFFVLLTGGIVFGIWQYRRNARQEAQASAA